jgi:ABC-type Zn2+ transport system substrate-binding protein/surface adhesin
MARKTDYRSEAISDAADTAENFLDEIVEQLMDEGKASDDLQNDYDDSYHHENHVDKDYDLQEAAQLLDDLSDYEETDYGLWMGLEPRRAIAAQAAYTYGNAVLSFFDQLIKEINEDGDLADLMAKLAPIEDEVADELRVAEEEFNKVREDLRDGKDFEPHFDQDEEIDRRKAILEKQVRARVEAIIGEFRR